MVSAPGPGAESYDTRSTPDGIVHATEGQGPAWAHALEQGVSDAAASQGQALEPDGRLGILCAWVIEHLGPNVGPPPHEVVAFFAHHLGLVEPVPHLLVLGMPDPLRLEQSVNTQVQSLLGRSRYNRYGGAIATRRGVTVAVLALSNRALDLEPVARTLPVGATLRLRGVLGAGNENPRFAIQLPDGTVARPESQSGNRFDVTLPVQEAGRYQVELLADASRGDVVVANFPVFVGVEPPTSVRVHAPPESEDAAGVERALLERLNESRRAASLPALVSHPGLVAVARAHSEDMRRNGFVGHLSPTTGSPTDRVARAGFPTMLVLENIGRGYDSEEVHRGLLESPGHRANLLNSNATHVGIAVVEEREGSRAAFLATEVFARIPSHVALEEAPGHLLDRVNAARTSRGAPVLEVDATLEEAARAAAAAFFSDSSLSQQDVVDHASSSLRRYALVFRRVGGVMAVVGEVDDATQLEPVLDETVTSVGIGVAQGTRPDTVRNAIAVVYVLGWTR